MNHIIHIPNIILTKEDREELDQVKKELRKLRKKLSKECYFEGFKKVE